MHVRIALCNSKTTYCDLNLLDKCSIAQLQIDKQDTQIRSLYSYPTNATIKGATKFDVFQIQLMLFFIHFIDFKIVCNQPNL